jgi:hypothetical protein
MAGADITYTLLVDQTPVEAFNAVNILRNLITKGK